MLYCAHLLDMMNSLIKYDDHLDVYNVTRAPSVGHKSSYSYHYSTMSTIIGLCTLTSYRKIPLNNKKMLIENIVIKGENAGNQHFLLLPQCFLPVFKYHHFNHIQSYILQAFKNSFRSKILSYGVKYNKSSNP